MGHSNIGMDIHKQPGIRCENILLAESTFRRTPSIPQDLNIDLSININNSLAEDESRLACNVTLTVNTENDPVFMKVSYVGIFTIDREKNMSLKHFADNHAAAIVWPYIREDVHGRMLKAGLPKTIILPPLNLYALMNSSEENEDKSDQ